MNATKPPTPRLGDLPLWKLLVLLDDAERALGANSSTTRALASAVRLKLRRQRPEPTTLRQEVVRG
jgi:hypothetical protein